jgi:integrase
MALAKITKAAVDRMEPGWLWDTQLVGFGARRQTNGVFYYLRYRRNGMQRIKSLGRHGHLTPDTARNAAQAALGKLAMGVDPFERTQAGETFGGIVPMFLNRKRDEVKPRTFTALFRHLTIYTKPLHPLPLASIDRRAISLRLGQIQDENGAVTRNRVRSSLSTFFRWSVAEGLINANPVTDTATADEGSSRERVLSDDEIRRLWGALGNDDFGGIVRLLILTGARRKEIGALRWSEVNLADRLIVLPAERVKNGRTHELPLSAPALALLEGWPRRNHTDLVFGAGADGFSGWAKALDRRLGVIAPWTLHDLRRTCATGMAEVGIQPHIIEAVLNHVSGHKASVAGIYNRAKYLEPMKEALQRWADKVDQITA